MIGRAVFKAIVMTGVESIKIAQDCFNRFIEITQTANIHSYDQSLEQSITRSNEVISSEALDELKRLNNEFASNSKLIIDNYYRQMYVYDDKCSTYLCSRTNPGSDLNELKLQIRKLVIDGLDFNL